MQVQQAPVHQVGPRPQPRRARPRPRPPVALWIARAAAVAIALVALFVPVGSTRVASVPLQCPSALDSVSGVARLADMTRSSQFTELAVREMAKSCPQTAVALGVGLMAALAGIVLLVIALVRTISLSRGAQQPPVPLALRPYQH